MGVARTFEAADHGTASSCTARAPPNFRRQQHGAEGARAAAAGGRGAVEGQVAGRHKLVRRIPQAVAERTVTRICETGQFLRLAGSVRIYVLSMHITHA